MLRRLLQSLLFRWLVPGVALTVLIAWCAVLFSPGGRSVITEFPPGSPWPWPDRSEVTPDPTETSARITLWGLDQWRGAAHWRDAPESGAIPIYPYGAFAGLPFRSLCTQTYWGSWSSDLDGDSAGVSKGVSDWRWGGIPVHSGPDSWRALPLRPLWTGFLADTVIWGTAWATCWHVIGWWMRRQRLRRDRCPTCAHRLSGASICPECGAELRGSVSRQRTP